MHSTSTSSTRRRGQTPAGAYQATSSSPSRSWTRPSARGGPRGRPRGRVPLRLDVCLLDQTLETVRRDCSDHGLDVHWRLFLERVVEPILAINQPLLWVPSARNTRSTIPEGLQHDRNGEETFQSAVRERVRPTVLEEANWTMNSQKSCNCCPGLRKIPDDGWTIE